MRKTERQNSREENTLRWSSAFKIILLLIVILGITLVGLAGAYAITAISESPKIDPKNVRSAIAETSVVRDKDGENVERLVQNEFSEWVPIDRMPKHLLEAAVAIEDQRFYEHNGVDFRRLISATIRNLQNMDFSQGGSTITMQVAKNLYTSPVQSFARKFRDIYYAFQLESNLSKKQILEAYLNSAAFSKGTIGVQAAAKTFFDKDVEDLTLAESAMIIGVTNRPSEYTPYNVAPIEEGDDLENIQIALVPANATDNKVAENAEGEEGSEEGGVSEEDVQLAETLAEMGTVDPFELSQIKSGDIIVRKAVPNPQSKKRQELILHKMNALGMIDESTMQEAIDEPINLKLGIRTTKGISSYYVDAVKDEVLEILRSQGHEEEEAQNILYNGGLVIETPLDLNIQKILEDKVAQNSFFPGRHTDKKGILQPQVGITVMNHQSGQVVALVGGRGIGGNNILNRAKTPRQPGSAIKPIGPYLALLNEGGTAADVYRDLPRPGGWPKNSTGYQGYATVRNLIRNSSNVGAYLVGKGLAPDESEASRMMIENLRQMQISTVVTPEDNDKYPNIDTTKYNDVNLASLTLGGMTIGISPLEMAGAFSTFPNHGEFIKPSFIDKITDKSGAVIYENPREAVEITSPQNAYIMTSMLEGVVRSGTGTYARFGGMHMAGKTGTTNDKRDSWFVGYTPYYTASVWIGNDDNTSLWDHSRMAANLWRSIMRDVHSDLEDKDFEEPEEGLYSRYISAAGYTEIFADGTAAKGTKKLYRNIPPKPKKPKVTKQDNDSDKSNSNGNSQGSGNSQGGGNGNSGNGSGNSSEQ
ncbi:MAG: transglycosylase domain-containing protein [Peptoniphilus sp.]|nr:transglycosylase domain-containing protein [Peptoniphilus sp.]MDD7363036.1 transglycosylase domain-containing protein [Bacillota bacterium]MDY6045301.1 transglycosylase domain-containing protein [Peptoniphilus sp.]